MLRPTFGGAAVGPYAPHNDSLTFSPWESFTLQGWFKMEAVGPQMMLANAREYGLGVKDGRLFAWIMQDGGQTAEANGGPTERRQGNGERRGVE